MKCRFGDERLYIFHDDDDPGICFFCQEDSREMFVVRETKTHRMIHLCSSCLTERCSDYVLDNTRPWEEQR